MEEASDSAPILRSESSGQSLDTTQKSSSRLNNMPQVDNPKPPRVDTSNETTLPVLETLHALLEVNKVQANQIQKILDNLEPLPEICSNVSSTNELLSLFCKRTRTSTRHLTQGLRRNQDDLSYIVDMGVNGMDRWTDGVGSMRDVVDLIKGVSTRMDRLEAKLDLLLPGGSSCSSQSSGEVSGGPGETE